MLPGEIIEGKHKPIVSKEDFLIINSERTPQLKEYKTDNVQLPLNQFFYCKCRENGCGCNKSAKQLHEQFDKKLCSYQVDSKYVDIIKEVMICTYDSVDKEIRENEANVKKQLSQLKSKIDTIEERFSIGEIDKEIYIKFKAKYESEEKKLESNLFSSTISSSNLQIAIDKALKMSSNPSELWASGDLPQKKKIQSLVFPSGIGYDKLKGKVQTKRVNSIFSAIPLLSTDLAKIKSGDPVDFNQFSARVTSARFKLATSTAVMWCTIQLCYEAIYCCKSRKIDRTDY